MANSKNKKPLLPTGKNTGNLLSKNYVQLITLVILVAISVILLSFRLTEVPPGINGDEASIGYNAALLSESLHDENGRFLPFFTLTLAGKDWKQPVTMYTTAAFFKVFGPSYFLLRFVSIFFVVLSAILLYLVARSLFSFQLSIFSIVLFVTTPIIFIQSHLALENIAPVPFILMWLLMIRYFELKKKKYYLLLGGFSLGIGMYSYNGMRLVVPVLCIATLLYIMFFLSKKDILSKIKPSMWFLLGILPFFLIVPLINIYYAGAFLGNNEPRTITTYQQLLLPYFSIFDLSFLYINGDSTPYHSTGKHGIFLLVTLPIFILGVLSIRSLKSSFLFFVTFLFFLSPLLYSLTGTIYRGSRLVALVPFYILICCAGIQYLYSSMSKEKILGMRNKFLRVSAIVTLLILIAMNFTDFLVYYWFYYPQQVRKNFSVNTPKGYKSLYEKSNKLNLKPVIQVDAYGNENEAARFFEKAYFNNLEKWKLNDPFKDGTIILGYNNLTNFDATQVKEEKIEDTEFSLYVKR